MPGSKTVGRVSVRVLPDTSDFSKALQADLTKLEKSLTIRIPTGLNTTGLHKDLQALEHLGAEHTVLFKTGIDGTSAEAEAEKLRRTLSGKKITFKATVDKSLGATLSALGSVAGLAKTTLAVAALAAAAGSAVSAVGGLGAALVTMSGALLLLPALGAAGAAGLAALVVGFQGFGDALKAMGDPAKFDEALRNLAPAAADTARALKELGPAARDLRLDVQARLFAGVGEQVRILGTTWLPVLRTGLAGLAGEANTAFLGVSRVLQTPQSLSDAGTLFANLRAAFAELAQAAGPVVAALRDIGTVGSQFLPGLVAGAGAAAQRFAGFIAQARQTGQLQQVISSGLSALGDLFTILGNVGSLVVSIFGAASGSGVSFLATLKELTGQAAAFVQSAQGMTALRQIFSGIGAVISALGPLLGEVARVVATTLAPAIAELGPQLARAFSALQPAIEPLGRALAALAPVVGTVAEMFAGVLAEAIAALAPVVVELAPVLRQIATVLGQALMTAIRAIAPVLPQIAAAFGQIALALVPLIPPLLKIITAILPPLATLLIGLTPVITRVIGVITQLATAIAPLVSQLATALIPVMESLLPIVQSVFGTILAVISGAMTAIQGVINIVLGLISGDWSQVWEGIKQVLSGIWEAIKGLISGALDTVRSIMSAAWDAVTGLVRRAWDGIGAAIRDGIGNALSFVRELPGRILDALGNLGGLLFNAGRDVIQGLLNGLRNAAGAVKDFLLNLIENAVDSVLSFLGIGSPSKLMRQIGKWTGEGFAQGVDDMTPVAARAADRLANAAVFAPPTTAEQSGHVRSDGLDSIGDRVVEALSQWSVQIDGNGLAKLVNKANVRKARRG